MYIQYFLIFVAFFQLFLSFFHVFFYFSNLKKKYKKNRNIGKNLKKNYENLNRKTPKYPSMSFFFVDSSGSTRNPVPVDPLWTRDRVLAATNRKKLKKTKLSRTIQKISRKSKTKKKFEKNRGNS